MISIHIVPSVAFTVSAKRRYHGTNYNLKAPESALFGGGVGVRSFGPRRLQRSFVPARSLDPVGEFSTDSVPKKLIPRTSLPPYVCPEDTTATQVMKVMAGAKKVRLLFNRETADFLSKQNPPTVAQISSSTSLPRPKSLARPHVVGPSPVCSTLPRV